MRLPSYYMFIDESGDASLNNLGKDFFLSAVIIERSDFEIIQGYMRLLKRSFFDDDHKILHATDLFERPYQNYRKLVAPRDKTGTFIQRLREILAIIPYSSCVYHVNKDDIRKTVGYKPAKGRKPTYINLDLPYEKASYEAIRDFVDFLKAHKATGEIVIESRLHRDSNFVTYFDNMRKQTINGAPNPYYDDARKLIPSLFISNKDSGNVGLEIVDLVSYVASRKTVGDPFTRMKIPIHQIHNLYSAIKKSAHKGSPADIIHKI